MLRSLLCPVVLFAFALGGCSAVNTVVMPDAVSINAPDRAYIWKEYKGMYVSMDDHQDDNSEKFTQYTVAPGKHQVEVTIMRLIRDTGYVYSGKPLTWKGTIDAKPGHRYLIMAKDNQGANGIMLYMQDQSPPDFENVEDVALADMPLQ